jgi:alkylation response protein AidB-like acyl-CoA dehydrogenase
MDFSLSDHHLLIRDTVREFMQTEVRPHVKDWERSDYFPREVIKKLGALGCCGMLLPEEWGGPGLDAISYVLMLEEVAQVHAAMATAISVTNSAVQTPLLAFGTDEQKSRYLRRLASGEILGAFCLTEPAAGSDAAGIQSTAVPCSAGSLDPSVVEQGESSSPAALSSPSNDWHSERSEESLLPSGASAPGADVARGLLGSSSGAPSFATVAKGGSAARFSSQHGSRTTDHYLLNGTKTWVTNGSVAGLYLVFAKTDPAAGGKGITAFLLEPNTPGLKIGRHEDKMGQRSSPSVEILLDNCVVPAYARLGEPGQGLKIALSALDNGRIGIAALAVGLAQGALNESVKYARARRAFGKSIGEFQAIQWMIADMHTELEAARALVYQAAFLKDRNSSVANGQAARRSLGEGGSAPSRAKLYASEMANRVVYKAVQIHGSLGYSRESDVERMYRDARVLTIYEGTSEIQRTIIARGLLRS